MKYLMGLFNIFLGGLNFSYMIKNTNEFLAMQDDKIFLLLALSFTGTIFCTTMGIKYIGEKK